jgi:hypothetical protein
MTELHQALLKLREDGPSNIFQGICHQGDVIEQKKLLSSFFFFFFFFFSLWPEFSGDLVFPVSHPSMTPGEAYMLIDDIWDRETEYGRARWRLLDFLIERTAPDA